MAKLYEFPKEKRVNRIYELDFCAGCKNPIDPFEDLTKDFTVIVLPSGKGEKHIVLCEECAEEARKHGVIK